MAVYQECCHAGVGWKAPLHLHAGEAESWCVIDGALCVRVGERNVQLGPGEAITVAPGTPHSFRVATGGDTRYLLIMGPRTAALVDALHQAGAPPAGSDAMALGGVAADMVPDTGGVWWWGAEPFAQRSSSLAAPRKGAAGEVVEKTVTSIGSAMPTGARARPARWPCRSPPASD